MKKQIIRIMAICLALAMCLMPVGCNQSDGEWISEVYYESGEAQTTDADTEVKDNDTDKTSDSKTSTGKSTTGKSSAGKTNTNSNLSTKNKAASTKSPLKADLGGATINIYGYDPSQVSASSSKADAATVSMFNKLEEKLNCKITGTRMDSQQMYQQVLLNIASGTYFADLIVAPMYTAVGYINSEFTYDLNKLSTVDLTQDYMNIADGVNAFQLGTQFHALADPLTNAQFGNFVFVNKRILKEVTGSENYVYDLINKKQWSVPNFRELATKATKDLDGATGISLADRPGIVVCDIGTSANSCMLSAYGAEMLKKENGKIVYNMHDEKVLNALNMSYTIFIKDGIARGASDADFMNAFRTGHALFGVGGYLGGMLSTIADMEDDFGIVPFPTVDGNTNFELPANWNFSALMIPSNLSSEQADKAGAFLQAFCYLAKSVNKVRYDEYSSRYLRDKQSREYLDVCYNAVRITPSIVAGNSSLQDIFNGTYKVAQQVTNGEDFSTMVQSTEKTCKAGIDELNKKFK